jgi:hypothetical protein
VLDLILPGLGCGLEETGSAFDPVSGKENPLAITVSSNGRGPGTAQVSWWTGERAVQQQRRGA